MAKVTLREIMVKAHKIAKGLKGDYQARLSYALKVAWAEYRGGFSMNVKFLGTDNEIEKAQKIWKKTVGRALRELDENFDKAKFRTEEGKKSAMERVEATKNYLVEEGLDASSFIKRWVNYTDVEFIRVVNEVRDYLEDVTGHQITFRAWKVVAEKHYIKI